MIGLADPTPTPSIAVAVPPAPAPSATPEPVKVVETARCFEQARDSLCKQVHEWTDNAWLAESSDWLIAKPSKILVILLIALVIRRVVFQAINRLCERAVSGAVTGVLSKARIVTTDNSPQTRERRKQRAATLASVLESIATAVIFTMAILMCLSELSFNIGPLIASAGIVGVAVGFGAQALVKDFLSGIFMILEDQFGVGDEVDLSTPELVTNGVVESVGLRITRLRDDDGVIWYIRNGEILRVGNRTQRVLPTPPLGTEG
ncbi:MAG: mechanosensitive ion channel family protein [Sporichthyaceae bacterium]